MFSIEGHPEFPYRALDDCVRHVAAQLEGCDAKVGVAAATEEERDRYAEMGATVFLERRDD